MDRYVKHDLDEKDQSGPTSKAVQYLHVNDQVLGPRGWKCTRYLGEKKTQRAGRTERPLR